MALSPMMQQYNSIKDKYNDCLIMFRLGDFYELFFDDAIIASRVLELTLTGRNCGLDEKAPMCGVPHHAVDSYLVRLVKAGYKVAICEQLEDPATAKGIVERDVVRIVTPGTIDVLEGSESDDNIYIASVQIGEGTTAVAISDISTGEFFCFDFADETGDILASELARYMPREVISSVNCKDALNAILSNATINPFINYYDEPYFKFSACEETIKRHFDVTSLMAFGIDGRDELIEASGSLLMYLMDTQKQAPSQIKDFTVKNITNSMQLDRSTMRNLELLETLFDKDVHGSLFGVLNKTKTAMGARLLKSMLKEPLKDAAEINLRLEAVKELKDNPHSANILNVCLRQAYDLQRLSARIASGRANARDLQALRVTLDQMPIISDELSNYSSDLIKNIRKSILCEESRQAITYDFPFIEIAGKIESAIVDEPPFLITEGGIIRDGYSDKLKELKDSIADAKLWISNLENTEKERTGIKTIKVGFNKVFGYYIDVSKSFIDKVPPEYIRKQTLVNNERYITPELKEKETLVLSAESKINTIEYELFKELRESIEPHVSNLQKVSSAIAMLDVLLSFAKVAQENNYVQPTVDNSDNIIIENGRHPTVEKMIGAGLFVSNNTNINNKDRSMLIITGPNMAGKSTYMRQTALIVLMAQIGSFVPADSAHIGVVDRVFTRIGASDNLSAGQSTFYIEMSELANILRNATPKSLIILDEIGRGTSTFDGLSIAWATVEFLCRPEKNIRTMFATHYHELTELCVTYPSVCNLSVAVAEDKNDIVFLHNIVEGPASKSYGIHVAKIAGVPSEIRNNAIIKLRELEEGKVQTEYSGIQLSFVNEPVNDTYQVAEDLVSKIADVDINVLTPLNAMNLLSEFISEAKEVRGGFDD